MQPHSKMEHSFVSLLVVAVTCVSAIPDDAYRNALQFDPKGRNTRGADFMVAFMPNSPVLFSQPQYLLLISTVEPDPVTFTVTLNENLPAEMREGFPYTATISYGEVHTVNLPVDIALALGSSASSSSIERFKTIRVRTENNKQITVQGFNDDVRTSDGFVAISCDAMRLPVFNHFEYLVLAADQFPSQEDPPKDSLVLMIPCDDDTTITVEPSQLLTVGQLADLGPNRFRAGPGTSHSSLSFPGNSGQSTMIGHKNDLSGTIVRGDKPLIVFSGHQCGEIPYNFTACDHMVEQIPPGMSYGQTFFLPPLGGRVSGDQFRVGTLRDDTQVTVTCVRSGTDTPTRLPLEGNGEISRGGYITFMTPGNYDNHPDYKPSYCCLDSTQPVIVAQYSMGYNVDKLLLRKNQFSTYEAGDPFMSLIPPVHQYMNNHTVKSVDGVPGPFPFRYINLAIATDFFMNSTSDRNRVKINDTAVVPYDGYIPFYCSNGRICGYGAQVEVPKGTHTIYHEQHQVGLYAHYYAYQQQNSNAFPLGFELEPLAATGAILPENICIREDIGTLVIPVERYGALVIQSRLAVVTQPSNPVEAVAGEDYTYYETKFNFRGGTRQDTLKFVYIPIIDDTIAEQRESFEVVFTPRRNLYLRNNIVKVIICDNDGERVDSCICDEVPIEVWFEPTSYTINEAAGTVTLTIRTNIAGGPPVGAIRFGTRDGTATAESDYISTTMYEVAFAEGAYTTTVEIPIIDDSIGEGEEIFYGSLATSGDANVIITEDTAEVHIIDDDVLVWFQPSSYTVVEAAQTIIFTIRTNLAGGPAVGSVTFTTVNGTATATSDYITTTYDVTFEAGSYITTVEVPIVDDSIGEVAETFYGTLTVVGSSPVQITEGRAEVLIIDDDMRVWFEPTSYIIDESSGTVNLIVWTNVPGGPPLGEVEFYTLDETATSSVDFRELLGFPVIFTEDSFVTSAAVTIYEDSILEHDEVFIAKLRHVGVETISIVEDEARVTITDNDVVEVGFVPSTYIINEQGSFVVLTVENRNPGLERDIVVQVGTVSGSATEGSDYMGSVQAITFTSESTRETVTVFIMDDEEYEGTEDFYATLTTTETAVTIFEEEAKITIIDDDVKVFFEVDTYEVSETANSVELCVRRVGDVSGSLTIQVSSGDFPIPQAEGGSDYQQLQQVSVTFEPNEDKACFNVSILDDSLSEGPENFFATIFSASTVVDVGSPDTTIISIMDDESLIIDFVASEYTVSEEETVIPVCLRTNTGNDEPVNIIITTSHISTSDGDYDSSSQVVIIPASIEPSVTCADIRIIDDTIVERSEDFRVAFEVPTGTNANAGVFNTTRVVILDNDNAKIGFNPTVYSVDESAGVVIIEIENMTPDMKRDVVVQFFTVDGSAIDGNDFIGIQNFFSHTLTFSPGESKEYVIVPIEDDSIFEGSEEFYGSLIASNGGVTITEDKATVYIVDNDVVEIGFIPNSFIVEEGETAVLVVENRSPDIETEITVHVDFTDGTATVEEDYIVSVVDVTFSPGDTQVPVSVQIIDDAILERTEDFYATARVFDSRVTVFEQTANIRIQDNDEVWISFEFELYAVEENRGQVIVCLEREGEISETLTVTVSTNEMDQAKSDDDFVQISGVPVQFRPDQYRACFPISIINDEVYEGVSENFTVAISTVPLGVGLGETDSTIISIVDDDKLEPISAELCGDVCDRLDRIDAMLDKICDKLNIQGDQLLQVLTLLSDQLPEK